MNMTTATPGKTLIMHFEGCKLTSYICPAGVLTIGYGHTGRDVVADMSITAEQAANLLADDLKSFESAVNRLVTVSVTQNQFDALVSFAYNLGSGNLAASTLLKLLNSGDYQGAADQFPRWNKAAGKVLPGLTLRRNAERDLFLKG